MASGGIPQNEKEIWEPPGKGVGKPQMNEREDERRQDHTKNRNGKTIQRIDVDSQWHLNFLEKLNFQDYFLQKQPTFDGKFRYVKEDSKFYLETLCTNEIRDEISETKDIFLSSIKPIRLDCNVQALLFSKHSKCASDLKQKLKERTVNCLFIEQKKYIFAMSEYVKKVEEVINELFLCMTVPYKDPRYFHFTTENFQKFRKRYENKDFEFERKFGAISFAAVKSAVADELLEAMRWYESGKCEYVYTPSQAEAIKKWGTEKKEENWVVLNQLHSEGRYIYSRRALLLKEKPTEEYIKQKLTTKQIHALFETVSDDCVNLMALNKNEADRAEALLKDSICEFFFGFTDKILEKINSEGFKKQFGMWNGKFVFDGLESKEEIHLFATDDALYRLKEFVFGNSCPNKKETVSTKSIIHQDFCEKFETNLMEIENKYGCKISKKFLGPHLANCWILGKKKDYFRVHLIAGHAESLNVDAVVCPCTSVMFPVNDCFGMFRDIMSDMSTAKKHEMNHTVETIAPDGFHCERIISLVTCEPNNANKVDLVSNVKNVLLKAEELSCQSLAIPLTLLPESIMKKKDQARDIAVALRDRPKLYTLEEVFVCECSSHPSNEIENLWTKLFCETDERYVNFKPLQESAVRMAIPQKESIHKPAINVQIVIDTLISQQVNAIVNTCQRNLDLTQGTVSKIIHKVGGDSIQEELDKREDGELRFGEIAVTSGGKLQCQYIFHGALFNWTPVGNFSLKVLKLMIWNCLTEAEKLKCSSIAFPSLGTGNLLHPFHLVAETMFHTIQCYEQCHSDTKIKNISIVLHEKDEECIQQFKMVEKMKENLFQSREECHPPEYLTCKKILASRSVTVDLLPSRSTWRWGSLLSMTFCSKVKGLKLDPNNSCWNLKINPPPNWFSSLASSLTSSESYFLKESLDIKNKRITSIELSLSDSSDGCKKQIDDFFYLLNCMKKDFFINHVLIVFPSKKAFVKESKNVEGHWKTRGRLDDFPIAYTLTGDPQDISSAKQEIDDIITKMERDLQKRKKDHLKDTENGSSVDPQLSDFPIFQSVTGVVYMDTIEESKIKVMKTIIADAGCKHKDNNNSPSIFIEGSLSQIVKANQRLIETNRNDVNKTNVADKPVLIINIPMSERDYQAVKFFGHKINWFKGIINKVTYSEGSLLVTDLTADSVDIMKEKIEQFWMKVSMMSSENVSLKNMDIDLKKAIEDVEQEKPNVCFIKTDNDIEIISENYTELQEAKGLLLQMSLAKTKGSLQLSAGKGNRRAGRTFTKTEEKNKNSQMLEKPNQDRNLNEMADLSMNQSMRSRKVEMETNEGLMIKIYVGSITRLDVDCIVNAANENLMHGGGVAAAISEAAGYLFDQESRDYVQKNGPIQVGTCCVTSAGKLPYKYVIHTVGPRWGEYRDKNRCLRDLQDSVEATFIEADERKMSSIAIPAISSGIFAVPRDKCVEEYYRAAMSFSKSYSFKSLREIHFVDRDETMVRAIQEIFLQREPSATIIGKSENLEKKNDTTAFEMEKPDQSTMTPSISYTTVNVSNSLQIKIHIGNITDIAVDAVVCPQDKDCLSENEIARDILGNIPDKQPSFKLMKYGDVCSQKLQENSKWKMIIHAVTPVYDFEYAKNPSEFVKTLNTIIQKILKTADEAKLHSIAIPLLGTGTEEYKTPVETCASCFFKAVMANKSELRYLNDIYLVLKEKEQEKMYLEDFACSSCKITQRPVTNNGKSDFGKTMKERPKEGENCCICMDTPTKPKQLQKCGHVFCKECIEQYFQYKPTCPSCGTIYGKVTGDQPPGTMSIRTNGIRLQGFNDSSGTIVLTYIFNDGKQGEEHPDPGKVYKGINRSGYLPYNKKGRLIAKLLNVAFSRRLVFTIGRSRTTGHDGVITWNDIHHKTRMEGGPARFGYPDPTYLDRVLEELEVKGVTEESADDPEEYKEYSREIRY